MKNYLYSGETINVTAPAEGAVGGMPLQIGSLIVMPVTSAPAGTLVACKMYGVFTLPKLPADAIGQLAKLYWDNANKRLTLAAEGNTEAGVAWETAAAGTTSVSLKLKEF